MAIRIAKASEGAFDAEISPPESRVQWKTPKPMPLRALIDELKRRGCHQTDVTDALYDLDPEWVSKLD